MLSGSVIPGLSDALSSRSTEKRLLLSCFDNLNGVVKVAGHSVIVRARLSV